MAVYSGLGQVLAERMGETWALLDVEKRDWWNRLGEEVERVTGYDDEEVF